MLDTKREATKLKIKENFAKLILEKGFESLTVSDVARRCKINRGTFYLHFLDKHDLLQQLEEELLSGFKETFEGKGSTKPTDERYFMSHEIIVNSLHYALDNFLVIRALISERGDLRFIEDFKLLLRNHLRKKSIYFPTIKTMFGEIPMDYAEEILLSRTTSILLLWLKKGSIESPDLIANLIIKAATAPPMI